MKGRVTERVREIFHPLVHFTDAIKNQGLGQEETMTLHGWQRPKDLSYHLLSPIVCICSKLDLGAELGLNQGILIWDVDLSSYSLTTAPLCQRSTTRDIGILIAHPSVF